MACIITYENKQYTQKEFEQYFKEHFTEFVGEFINTKPDVILPIGTSGSGKSTFIKSLPQENLVVIEPDAMRVEFTGDMNNKSKDKEIYEEAAKRAIQAIKQGKQVVFDTTNLTKDKRLPFIEAIKKAIPTANIQYKLMELNPELSKQRIKAQLARGENRAAVSDETIDRHAESYKQMLEDIKNEPISKYKDLGSKQDIEGFKEFVGNYKQMLEDIKNEPISNYEITPQQKQQAIQLYSQYLESLNKPNTNPILQGNQQEQIKKFIELQERLNNKEFLEGAKNAYESSEGLQEWGTQKQYNDYIARVSLGIIKNPSSGGFNYTSKVKDIVYHGTKGEKFDIVDFTKNKFGGNVFYVSILKNEAKGYAGTNGNIISLLINSKNIQFQRDAFFGNRPQSIKELTEEIQNISKAKFALQFIGEEINIRTFNSLKELDDFAQRNSGWEPLEEDVKKDKLKELTSLLNNLKLQGEFDTVLTNNDGGDKSIYIVNKPEQAHILGSQADIQGFKQFVENKNFAISEETVERVKELGKDLLVTDGDYTFGAGKQKQIVDNIKFLVYTDLLSLVKEGKRMAVSKAFSNAKESLIKTKKNIEFIANLTEEKFQQLLNNPKAKELYGHIESVEQAKYIASELERITKDDVFKQFEGQVVQDLKGLGITVKEENLQELSDIEKEEIEMDNEVQIEDNDFQNEKNYSVEVFQVNPRNTAGINVKLMLSKIPNSNRNYLGLSSYIPFDTVFDDLTLALSPVEGSLKSYIQEMKNIINGNPAKSYLKNLVEILESPETATSMKNQFVAVMNKHLGNFVLTLWKRTPNGMEVQTKYANDNSAVSVIVNQWAENMGQSRIVTTDSKGNKHIDKAVAAELNDKIKQLQGKGKEAHKEFMLELFDALGIFIDPNIVDVLYNTTQYKELDPKGKRKGNFEYQFTYSSTGVPQGVFSAIVDALNKENSKEIIEAAEDLMQLNNPFDGANKNSSVTFLAQVVAKYSNVHYASSHRNVENKMIYDSSFHIPITSRIKDLNVPNSPTRAILKELPFSSTAYWLSDSVKNIKLIMHDMDGLKELGKNTDGVTRTSMSEREQEFTSIGLFQDSESKHTAKFIGMTMSDKSRTPIIEAPKFKVNINTATLKDRHITKETLTEDSKEQIGNLVKVEAARIRNIRQRIKEDVDNKLKNEVGEQYYNGAQFFYFFPELNGLIYKDGKLDDTMLLNENLQVLIDTALDKVVETANNTIDKWWNVGIVYRDKKNKIATMFNKNYVSNSHLKENALVAYAATDIELNYIVFNANMMQLVQGDPAKFYNQKKVGKFDVVTRISKVMDEYQKREAKDAAPGEIGTTDWEFTDKNGVVRKGRPTYNVVFVADDKFGSITQGYLQTMPSYTEGLDRTDAQELTTLREHIDLLMNHGRIPDDIYASIMKKIEDAGVGGYYELTYDELGMVLGPQKPVQIVSRFDNGVESTFYIKSSSYPLIPQLTRGFGEDSDIEKIRVNMEKSNADRLAFITATKIGARNTVELFKDGKVVEDLDFTGKLNQLSRKGFTIQQDVPYDPKKHEIVVISQMDRLLMQGLSDVEFEFKGKKLLGKELKKIKENLRGQLMDMSKEDIFNRMGIEMVDGNPVVRNLDKLISILREEAIDRKWAINDIMALQIVDGNLVIPLAFNNSAERVETLISSLFTKIIKQKISGKSFVQASSSGYKNNTKTLDDLTASDKKGIVFLKGTGNDFNPKTGLTYTNLNEETKEVKVAQVFIPWKFAGKLEDFVKEGTSELDLDKIDPELLRMIGARIPNQGHSSQIVLQVVGFLPKVLGDLVIVPGEITKQMGSDFDVDKLYAYMYNNVVNAEGRLVKVPSAISENGDIDTKSLMDWAKDNFAKGKLDFGALSELDEDVDKRIKEGLKLAGLSKKALIKAALQNAYIEVHETVLTNSEVVKKALTPLDADDLSITGDNASTKQDRGLFISRDRQLKDFVRQQAGKSGVAIMSRAVVGGAMIEDYNLRLGTPTEKGYKDTPFKGFLDDSGDTIALINLSGEGKTEFNGEKRTKTRNTIIMQSGAVDNANKPVLDSNNLNSFTFNTAIAINRLSSEEGRILDLRYTSYFLNQEIIKDYINELKSLSDTLNEEFTADRKNAAAEDVKENYLKRAGLKEYKVVGKGFTPQMMLDLIKSTEKNSNDYIKDQLEILEHFVYLDTVGTELNEIYGALSTESKGVGKGYWDVLIRQEQLQKLGRKSTISGAVKLLEEGSQANKIAGYVYDAVKVMSQIFPYQTTQVQEIINTIETYADKTYTDKNLRQLIWENIKSYIFTHPDLATTPEDRNALFYGENSLAKQIEKFKKTPEGFNNRFMQRVRTKLGKTADMPDLVLLNASAAERTDEQEVVKHFVDLLTSPNESTRELGEKLIQYQFATGGLQKALQYVKYIPVSYLATTNFGAKLMEVINSLNDENSINMNAFIEQFYQHNPARARIYKEEVIDKILNEGIKFNVETDRVNNLLYTKDNVQDYVPYISIRDKKGNWVLLKKERYEGITLVYKPIPILGGHGKDYTSYNEFKFNEENIVSTIPSNNPKGTVLSQSRIIPVTKDEPTITNTEVYTVKASKYVNPFDAGATENLKFAMANLETERFKALSPLFTKNSNLLSDKFEIIIDNNLEYTDVDGNKRLARGLYYKGKVYLNPKVINNNVKTQGRDLTTEDIEKTLMHELGHAYTADLYRIYSESGTHKLLTPKVKQNFERIDVLRNVAYSMLTKEEKEKVNKIKTGKYGTPEQGINNKDLKTYYGFINTKEFISEVLTKPEFQKKLNEMSLNSTTSVFERVVKFIKDIYNEFIKTLGFTVEKNSVLENSLLEVMDLIHNSENVELNTELKNRLGIQGTIKENTTSGYKGYGIYNLKTDLTSSENISNQIYSQLGSKTVSKEAPNVVIKPWSELKDATKAITSEGIISTRIKNSNEHFGNPFSHDPAGKAYGLIKTETVQEAVENYIDWVTGNSKTELIRDVIQFNSKTKISSLTVDSLGELRITLLEGSSENWQDNVFTFSTTSNSNIFNNAVLRTYTKESLEKRFGKDVIEFIQNLRDRRIWIREQLQSGSLKDKPILYYKELGEPSHATALDYLINKYNWSRSIEESNIYTEYGTSYKFTLRNGKVVSGMYKQGRTGEWKNTSMSLTKLQTLYDKFLQEEQTSKEQEDIKLSSAINTFEFADGITIDTGNIELNAQQKEVLQQLADFYNNPFEKGNKTFALKGYAGTGKTTIMRFLTEYANKKKVFSDVKFSSPTHRANAVLKNSVGKDVFTLHALFGLSPEVDLEEFDARDSKFSMQNDAKLNRGNFLIIDESSMINDELYKFITEFSNNLSTKVLFVGDPAQIKPVKQTHLSKAFDSTDKSYELTKVERTGKNPLLAEVTSIRSGNALSNTSNVNDSGEGVVFINNEEVFLTKAVNLFTSEEFKDNPMLLRIITGTNAGVANLNSTIRKGIFKESSSNQFNEDEILMGYSNFRVNKDTKQPLIMNSGDYKIISVSPEREISVEGIPIKIFDLTLQNLLDTNSPSIFIPVLTRNNTQETLEKLGEKFEEVRQYAIAQSKIGNRKAWLRFYDFKNAFATTQEIKYKGLLKIPKTLDYGYAHTIHKSQGGTYTNIFVDDRTVESGFKQDKELQQQLRYVGLSRAKKTAYVMTNSEVKVGKIDVDLEISFDFTTFTNLGTTVGDYMKTLTKAQRNLLRELMDNKTIEFRCK